MTRMKYEELTNCLMSALRTNYAIYGMTLNSYYKAIESGDLSDDRLKMMRSDLEASKDVVIALVGRLLEGWK